MNEENMKRLSETIAKIISEREKVKVIVTIEKKRKCTKPLRYAFSLYNYRLI